MKSTETVVQLANERFARLKSFENFDFTSKQADLTKFKAELSKLTRQVTELEGQISEYLSFLGIQTKDVLSQDSGIDTKIRAAMQNHPAGASSKQIADTIGENGIDARTVTLFAKSHPSVMRREGKGPKTKYVLVDQGSSTGAPAQPSQVDRDDYTPLLTSTQAETISDGHCSLRHTLQHICAGNAPGELANVASLQAQETIDNRSGSLIVSQA